MKKRSLLLLLFFLITKAVFSQESCYNLDFETGTLNGWEGATGQCCPAILSGYQIVEGRHTMMKGSGFDPNTCNKVPVVAPGGLYSVRLGNEINGKEFETLSYALNVTEDNALFIYKYAVVLQDPNHPPEQQPYFRVNVFNENRDLIDPACGSYNVIATSDIPGFESCFVTNPLYNQPFTVVYKNWTTVGLDLTAYIGRKIIIEFQTGDCTRGGHFGYAYVDAYCSSLKIGAAYCSAANGAILSAPIGFSYLWDTGETTQSLRINNPIDGAKYNCEMSSVTGCKVTISTIITLLEPVINFEASTTCDKREVIFKNTTFNNDNNINSLLWDFGDGTTSTIENPRHLFPSVGTYNVTFSFSNSLGCQYTKTETIVISPTPEPHLIGGIICLDPKGVPVNDFILDSETSNVDYEYKWFLNGKLINGASKSTYVPLEKGNYSVLVTDSTSGCFNQVFAKVESSQMASDFIPKVSDAFATDNFVNIEVVGGTGPFLFQLDDNPFQESNSYSRLSSGEHTLVVKDSLNCTFISKQVTIMTFPMFFTPNNDGINDYWNIPNYKNFFEAQIAIFDRFGKLIKEISPLSLGWDGYHNGDLMPATDYWFTLNYKEMEQNGNLTSKSFKSHFTLKR